MPILILEGGFREFRQPIEEQFMCDLKGGQRSHRPLECFLYWAWA